MLFPSRRTTGKPGERASDQPSAHSVAGAILFDGQTDKMLALEGHLGLTAFTVDVRLNSARFPTHMPALSDTTPEMPFRVGSTITCQTAPAGYVVSLREGGKDIGKAALAGTHGPTRITIVSSEEGCTVFGDGQAAVRINKPVVLDAGARVGAGFLKRFWAGEILHFDVFEKAVVKGRSFDAAAGRFPAEHRIATLA